MSLVSTDPGTRLEGYSRIGYEFVADEATLEVRYEGRSRTRWGRDSQFE